MKLKAALLGSVVAPPTSSAAQKMAARFEPGQRVLLADGGSLRIVQKTASPTGLHFIVAGIGGQKHLSMRQLIDLGLVTPAMQRLANFVRRVLAFGGSLDEIVKQAIQGAGYPVDSEMNWNKYLNRIYGVTLSSIIPHDRQLQEEIIHDVVVHQLYVKSLLDPNSSYDGRFDPSRFPDDKPLDKRVTAFLVNLFTMRKDDVRDMAKRAVGSGSSGAGGLLEAESLDQSIDGEDEMSNNLADIETQQNNRDIDDYEGHDEIAGFLSAFKQYIQTTNRKQSYDILNFITDCYIAGKTRKEINQLVIGNPEFKNRKGQPFTRDNYNDAMALWVNLIRDFADDPESPWHGSAIARMFIRAVDKFVGNKEHVASVHGLHLADVFAEEPQQQTPPPPAPPAPAPNPNVQQQLSVSQPAKPSNQGQGLNLAPAAQDDEQDKNNNQPQEKKTIPPEIPGVNHTASSEDSTMPAEKKEAAPAKQASKKFARLVFIATKEPEAMGDALRQLASTFRGIGDKLANMQDHFDLKAAAPPADATIRQKIAFRNQFGKSLRQIASENPEEVESALNDLYSQLEGAVEDVEIFAENLGVNLAEPKAPAEGEVEPTVEQANEGESETKLPPIDEVLDANA